MEEPVILSARVFPSPAAVVSSVFVLVRLNRATKTDFFSRTGKNLVQE
jgi:hypothetical protein